MFSNTSSRALGSAPTKAHRPRSVIPQKLLRGRTRPNLPLSSKYKTELCHYLAEQGRCPFGDQCTYAHSKTELRYIERHPKHKTLPCRDFSTVGFCPFGERCSFIHYKRDPDDILKTTYSPHDHSHQQQARGASFYSTQSWGSSSVTLTVSPTPDLDEIPDPEHGRLAGAARLPSPWNDMGLHCGNAVSFSYGAATTQDLLRVPGSLTQSHCGLSNGLMPSSPHSCSSSGYSGTPSLSPSGSRTCASIGTLSRASSTSDLSDIGTAAWPAAQLQFGFDSGASGYPQTSLSATGEDFDLLETSHYVPSRGQRLPIFKDISAKYDETNFNLV
ncbi:mRNA decay factor CTH2-like [Tropilaelaps mercedesae]|uniref:mRNA decay factor CTH2-like n=1 Tax=Tropilaelaps mercedesae TaxID=418985 RepID=A0A1V9XUZ3_9ACAR|nr:mRNA decay factor CTH2-like [Tropilaelaps mercedesae]